MKQRIFAFFVLGIVLSVLISSCKKGTTLVIWHTESDTETQRVFNEIGNKLKMQYPNLKVTNEYVSWGQLSDKLMNAIETEPELKLPDISHLQPYMVYSMYDRELLVDISEIIEYLENSYEDKIFPVVRDLQKFGNKHYGLAQHVGVSFILYRKDILMKEKISAPKTWTRFFEVCETLKNKGYGQPIAVPGISPFFMECILSEYLNSFDASILTEDLAPNLKNEKVINVLKKFEQMSNYITPDYESVEYLDQFDKLVKGQVVFIMFAGARAFKNFENQLGDKASPEVFSALIPPKFNVDQASYTSVDCEPFVIFKKQNKDPSIAKEWLKMFYDEENYLQFCKSVPIQLMPIFPKLMQKYEDETEEIKKWKPWFDQALYMIEQGYVRPYFLQKGMEKDIDFLFELHNSGIIYDLIISTIKNGLPDSILSDKQEELKNFIEQTSRRK